jgi:hypothetical protein
MYRFRDDADTYDRIVAEEFAAPVAGYIKKNGWCWQDVIVWESKRLGGVVYDHVVDGWRTRLVYSLKYQLWSPPEHGLEPHED